MVQQKSNNLIIAEFGSGSLRKSSLKIPSQKINTAETINLINSMEQLLLNKKLGVGLAAPQIGVDKQLAIIRIRPSEHRATVEKKDLNILNPVIREKYGRRKQMWEGCISGGPLKNGLFAKVPRYRKIKLEYCDEKSKKQIKLFDGLIAQVIQHEIDHLNGILFVDRVIDSKTFVTYKEYIKLVKSEKK